MNINTLFPSKYLKAADLPEEEVVEREIAKIKMEEVGKDRELKPVIYFKGEDKGFVANKTNCGAIAVYLGSEDTDNWPGKTIRLYRAEVEFQGDLVESIRVKRKAPARNQGPDDEQTEAPF
jgi:hypothetical protein